MEIGINARIAERVRGLRARLGLTLEALAELSGVSRSMISQIERAETSATAVLLEKLAAGLGVTLAALFEAPAAPGEPLSRRAGQAQWRDPATGYLRRNVSPPGFPSPIQIVEAVLPPGARVAYDSGAREGVVHQQVWVLQGVVELTVGEQGWRLAAGDCLAFRLDRPTTFHNPTNRIARHAVVIVSEPDLRR